MSTPRKTGYLDGWRDLHSFLSQYWRAYGGLRNLLISPYLHLSILLAGAAWPLWSVPGWWDVILSIIPSILGFTVGGFAIVLALGTGDFGAALSSARKPDKDPLDSMMGKLSAAFCHFILVQFTAVLLALLAKGFVTAPAPSFAPWLAETSIRRLFWGWSFFCGVYALSLAVSTAHWIFTCIKLLIKYQKLQGKRRIAQRALEERLRGGDGKGTQC